MLVESWRTWYHAASADIAGRAHCVRKPVAGFIECELGRHRRSESARANCGDLRVRASFRSRARGAAGCRTPPAGRSGRRRGQCNTASQSDLSPAKRKLRTLSNSRFVPVASSTIASFGPAAVAAPAAGADPPPPPRPPRPPRPPVTPLAYSRNAAHLLFPEIDGLAPATGAPPRPPAAPAAAVASPIAKRVSFAFAAVLRSTTSASPSFGARMYTNHLPSLESAGFRTAFHVSKSFSVSWRPALAGGVHFDTGSAVAAPNGRFALVFSRDRRRRGF